MSKKITHFKVVQASSIDYLQQEVRTEILNGWQPFQSWSILNTSPVSKFLEDYTHFTSLVKYSE